MEYKFKSYEVIFIIALFSVLLLSSIIFWKKWEVTKTNFEEKQKICTKNKNEIRQNIFIDSLTLLCENVKIDTSIYAYDMKFVNVSMANSILNKLVIRMRKEDCNCITERILEKIKLSNMDCANIVIVGNFDNPKYLKSFLQNHNSTIVSYNTTEKITPADSLTANTYTFFVDKTGHIHLFQQVTSVFFEKISDLYFEKVIEYEGCIK